MLLTCLALGLISCRDTIDPREAKPSSQVQQQKASGPVTVLRLTCTLSFPDGQQGEVSCGESGAGKKGVSQSVILPWYSQYAIWLPFNLVKDTTTETWTFIASVKNLLGQPIGTLDGTTVVGTKVFITYGPVASQGSGDVWIMNADGTGNFTAPGQKYFNYPWITQPQATSPYREWKTHVPNTVTEVTMGVAISTDFPAEQTVPALPPNSRPAWFSHDTSWANGGYAPNGFLKNVIAVLFEDSASYSDKQLAIALVNGTVIGGLPYRPGEDGYYYLRLADDGTGTQLRAAAAKLNALPKVYGAALIPRSRPSYLKPNDGPAWRDWSANPNSLSDGATWALEAINAPMAWGCETGASTTKVGVVDGPFDSTDVVSNVVFGQGLLGGSAGNPERHGAWVSSVLAARGNDSSGMTGVMWRAGLMLAALPDSGVVPMEVALAISRLGEAGAEVVNVAQEYSYSSLIVLPLTAYDSAQVDTAYRFFIRPYLRKAQQEGHLPFVVVSAGNSDVDAYMSPYNHITYDFPAIIVGASTRDRHRRYVSTRRGSNWGPLLDVYAPGENVFTQGKLGGSIAPVQISGTSIAAPFVAGIAGLLKSFDPSLTSAELRSLILGGASRGGRAVTDLHTSHAVYLADAYESLKLAAERPGAPLCGNRVWTADNAVYTERASGSATQLFGIGERAGFVNVLHGGRRVQVFGMDSFDYREFDYANGQWTDVGSAYGQPTPIWSGATNSLRGRNHDGDSVVYVQRGGSATSAQFTVMLRDTSASSVPRALHGWNVPLQIPTDICVQEDADVYWVPEDTLTHLRKYDCVLFAPAGASTSASAAATFSPLGDRIITTGSVSTTNSSVSAWSSCPGSFIWFNSSIESSHCRSISYQSSFSNAQVQSIRISDGQIQALPSIPTSYVFWQAVGESGKEMVVEVADVRDSYKYEPVPDSGWRTTSQPQSVIGCRVEYRDLSSGAVGRSIPLGDRCAVAGSDGIGTFSPMVSSRSVPVKASAPQP